MNNLRKVPQVIYIIALLFIYVWLLAIACIDYQLHRRNISKEQKTYLLGKRYKEEKKAVGENQYTIPKTEDTIKSGVVTVTTPKKTEERIAEQSKVSPKTVRNAEKFANAVDKVAKTTGINPQKILSNEVKATQNDIKKVATFEPEKQKQVFEAVEKKEHGNTRESINAQVKGQNDYSLDNKSTVVTPKTVQRAEQFTKAVDTISKTTGVSPQKILSEEVKATQTDIKKVAAFEPEKQKQVRRL